MLMRRNKAKQLPMAATARLIWLCAGVRYWPDRFIVVTYLSSFVLSVETPLRYFEKATSRFCRNIHNFIPSQAVSVKTGIHNFIPSSSMNRFIPPLSVLAPHDSNVAVYALISWLFWVLFIPLIDLVQARLWLVLHVDLISCLYF